MKRIILLVVMLGFVFSIKAQSLQGVIKGLETGNATTLGQNITDNVLITIDEKNDSYTKAQAEAQLKDFFAKVKVSGFETRHKGASPNGSYAVGTLKSAKGNYRTLIFMKSDAKGEVLKELRIILIE